METAAQMAIPCSVPRREKVQDYAQQGNLANKYHGQAALVGTLRDDR